MSCGMGDKGSNSSNSLEGGDWFIITEADCEDNEELTDLEKLFDESDCSDVSNLIDDEDYDETDEGNPQALLNEQLLQESCKHLSELKRKFCSPSPKEAILALSPQLQSCSLSSQPKNSKRKLFEDSGIENETEDVSPVAQVATESLQDSETVVTEQPAPADENGGQICMELLSSHNKKVTVLAKIKELFGVGYHELTRTYKSNKSCCHSWVMVVFGVREELVESSKILLQQQCDFIQIIKPSLNPVVTVMYLCEYKAAKNRETIFNLLKTMLNIQDYQIVADPPKHRSVPAALFWYKISMSNVSYKFGDFPDWLSKLTLVTHQTESETFDFSAMVQYAYDNDFVEEAEIAFNYAQLADEDTNAAAWLKHNNQLKFVKDCAHMVKLYKRYEMKNMTMSQWIDKCCMMCDGEGDWKTINNLLKYQDVNIVAFLTALRFMFKGIPKRNTVVISGIPDSGKSYFAYSLCRFLKGRVVSFMNSRSHFWIQPLADTKFGFLDDATHQCWVFLDTYLRNGLDGNLVSIDLKHRAPLQLKLPCMFITTNVNVMADESLKYLHSRVTEFKFNRKMPLDNEGNPLYKLTDGVWKSFFQKLTKQLGLEPEEENGVPQRAFRCAAREIN